MIAPGRRRCRRPDPDARRRECDIVAAIGVGIGLRPTVDGRHRDDAGLGSREGRRRIRTTIAGRRHHDRMTCNRAPQRQRNNGVGIAGKAHINDPRSASDKPIQPTDQCHHIRDGSAIRVGIESVGDSQLGARQQSRAPPDQDRGNGAGVLAGRGRSARRYERALDDAGTAQVRRCRVDGSIE